jgi:FtsP/CotA-like multicopper oxidase with cupredoxin domain
MTAHIVSLTLNRRRALQLSAGGALAGLGASLLPTADSLLKAAAAPLNTLTVSTFRHLVATDGWITLPGRVAPWAPDPFAPAPRTTYVFGFRDVTGLTDTQVQSQKGRVQNPAPFLYFDELDNIQITLSNLGLVQRPDLTDSHTIHWHGFRNALPLFDGVPEMSIAVPIGRDFPYFYRPHDPGTYM